MTTASSDGRRIDYLRLSISAARVSMSPLTFSSPCFLASCCFQVFLHGVEEVIHPEGLDCVTVGAPVHRIINMVRLGFSKYSREIPCCAGSNN